MTNDTTTIDGQVYDRQQILDWLRGESPYSVDRIPEGGVSIDRQAGTFALQWLAHDQDGNLMVVRGRHLTTEPAWGRYGSPPPAPLYEPEPAA